MDTTNSNMNETIKESIKSYHEQFKSNEWAYFLIPQINFTKGKNFNINKIIDSNIKKTPLKSLVSFLAKHFPEEYKQATEGLEPKQNASKAELANIIIEVVGLSHPYPHEDWPEESNTDETKNPDMNTESPDDNTDEEVEFAEEALSSPLISPGQGTPTNPNRKEESDHELSQMIQSISDEFKIDKELKMKDLMEKNEEKMKELVEKIKRVSISKDETENKIKPLPKRKKRKLGTKGRTEILNEYEKLNNQYDQLENEKALLEEKVKELETKLKAELEYHLKMEQLEEKIKNLDPRSSEKVVYEAETRQIMQDKKIKDLQNKLEESRKKNTEKQNEIKDLKKHNEKSLEEISNLKNATEKETQLRIKAEGILSLMEEKLEAQKILAQQEKENSTLRKDEIKELQTKIQLLKEELQKEKESNVKNLQEIEQLKETFKVKEEAEINHANDIESLERDNRKLRSNLAELQLSTPEPRILSDNREMITIIGNMEAQLEECKKQEHELTVKLVEANIELKLRKEMVDELNKSHNKHLEEISNSYIQKFLNYQKEVNDQVKRAENQKSNTSLGKNNEDNNLKKKLDDKCLEVEKLTEELNKIAEKKYEKLVEETKPKPRKQGLPNTYRNGCFVIAPVHALASCLDKNNLTEETETITKLISDTKECIYGTKTENEAEQIMRDIWEFSAEKWPQYTVEDGICKQWDAIEYMDRIVSDSQLLTNEIETSYVETMKCSNKDCTILSTCTRRKSHTNEIHSMNGIDRIDIQNIIDEHLLEREIVCPNCHETAKVHKKIEKAPNTLIISLSRHTEEGEKIETDVENRGESLIVYEGEQKVEYRVSGVIIHRGNQGQNGHYIYNHYNGKEWVQMDDHIININRHPEENRQGAIFLLRKMNQEQLHDTNNPYEEKVTNRSQQDHSKYKTNNQIPCRFYKYDKCRKGDECRFLHHTCKEFQEGNCQYNDYCQFRHALKTTTQPRQRQIHKQY